MAEKTKIEQYKKTDIQSRYEKKVFLEPLRKMVKDFSGKSRPIVFPKYISFKILENTKKLLLNIEEQEGRCGTEKKIENATCKNMQTDNAAFEGWAVCLKAWMPDIIESVELKWDIPHDIKDSDNEWCHYRRFLYRVLRFSEQYQWFSVSSNNINEIERFKREIHNLQNNNFSKIPDQKGNFDNLSETSVEFLLSSNLSSNMKKEYNLDFIDRQFPVGVKKNKKRFFTGGLSAIDLWGGKGDTLTIFELKYVPENTKSKNIKVGIISELFMYSCIMRDILTGLITKPDYTPIENENRFYANIKDYTHIKAYMLANEFHPLIDNKEILQVLNDQTLGNSHINIDFKKTKYDLKSIKEVLFYEN